MTVLRTDIERALDELASQEEGMRFQGLAVVLGKKRWPELISRQRKKDGGLDAYAPASLSPDKIGKGLAASITSTLKKIAEDAKTAKEHFPDLKALLFVTSAKVGNADRKRWEEFILREHNLELHIMEREEIITLMMMPENASLGASFLRINVDAEPQIAVLIEKTKRAAGHVTQTWANKTKGLPLIDLTAVRLDPDGAESAEVIALEQIEQLLSQSGRIVLEGPAGRGKTTTLVQIAQRYSPIGTPFIIDLPALTSSRRGVLEYISGMPAFQAERLTAADLAEVQQTEPILLLLNGWNEIAESSSAHANHLLREVERDFPSAGIIVATRTHHFTPPLPGAMRARLLRIQPEQRTAYLIARLGEKAAELCDLIHSDPSLDELTRTPFVLSEVASLFNSGIKIPSTKIGVLAEVLRLQEQRDEHRNSLQTAPIFGRHEDYLKALATEMTQRGAVALPETEARTAAAEVSRKLTHDGQIDPVGAPTVLATLTAHHVLERMDYPQPAFQFEHQQLQEYYAAINVRARLIELEDDDQNALSRFMADYVNDPAWTEPLRMIAETLADQPADDSASKQYIEAGARLVYMALRVDLVLAGELARLCGAAAWNKVRGVVGERLRAAYAICDNSFRHYAIAAMLATGSDDFSDLIVPLLTDEDQQKRLQIYRLWPDFHASSLGDNWRDMVPQWSEEARTDFVSELLHQRFDAEIVALATQDKSPMVQRAAAYGLMWTGSSNALITFLKSMDDQSFREIARTNYDEMPQALIPRAIAAMRTTIDSTVEDHIRLQTAINLINLGQPDLKNAIKDSLAALPRGDLRELSSSYIQPALEHLRNADPSWISEWIATKIADGALYDHGFWLPYATAISDEITEKYLLRLENEELEHADYRGLISIVAASADATLATRVFSKLRELECKLPGAPINELKFERRVIRQLEDLYRHLPGNVAATGILSSAINGDPLDIKIAANLLTSIAKPDQETPKIVDENLKARARRYLKDNVDLVLNQEDFNGEEKANLASALSWLGEPEDMADLARLIRADIERVRRGRAARAAGDQGPMGQGGSVTYAAWHISAVLRLDTAGAEQMLIDLLPQPEYRSYVAAAMARDFDLLDNFNREFRYELIWTAREGRKPPQTSEQRRVRFSVALNAEIRRLQQQSKRGDPIAGIKEVAAALAAVDGKNSTAAIIDAISIPGKWDQNVCLDALKRLLLSGAAVPAAAAFTLLDSIIERTQKQMQNFDRHLLADILKLCPFVDDPALGISKMRDTLGKQLLWGHHIGEIVTALGNCRSDAGIDLLLELASDARIFEQCQDNFINALAKLDTPRAHEILLGFIDPDVPNNMQVQRHNGEYALIARMTEIVHSKPEVAARLIALSERDLPEPARSILSRVLSQLDTVEALTANLNVIDDTKSTTIPQGVWEQFRSTLIERRPYNQNTNFFTEHLRASNGLRARLFGMATDDPKRQRSACKLLGLIEEWRLEYGRPLKEPRHPDLASGHPWPPAEH